MRIAELREFLLIVLVLFMVLTGCRKGVTTPVDEAPLTATPQPEPTPVTGVLVTVVVPDTGIKAGDTFDIAVEVHRVENLTGAEIHMTFDPEWIVFEDADPDEEGVQVVHGELLNPDFVAVNMGDNAQGELSYAIAQMPPSPPVNGDGVLFATRATALKSGTTELVVTAAILADAKGKQIPVTVVDATVILQIK